MLHVRIAFPRRQRSLAVPTLLLTLALSTNNPPETLRIANKADRPWQQPRQPQSATLRSALASDFQSHRESRVTVP
ncbi:hypothetical protein DE146DRAFT_640220 [Phaeosphaeria sp. MPI-PUGE-AT-0046c]|nr:hypothetical protein DE146DRAFT_640220 [Phaeosphaeria sp. MPI-PUGE-AT-0046c]